LLSLWPEAHPPAGWTLLAVPDPLPDHLNWELGQGRLVLHAVTSEPLVVVSRPDGSAPAPRELLVAFPPGALPSGPAERDHGPRHTPLDGRRAHWSRGFVTVPG
jgi:hypothetical protein